MHADGHRCNDKSRYRLNCFLIVIDRQWRKRSAHTGRSGTSFRPKGWMLTGWSALSARRSKNTSSGFIGVHPCSSCEKDAFKQLKKRCNKDGHRWMIKTDTGKIVSLIVIERQWRKRSAHTGGPGARFLPKGWILTGWPASSARRSKDISSRFISVHQHLSCEKILCNKDARRTPDDLSCSLPNNISSLAETKNDIANCLSQIIELSQ